MRRDGHFHRPKTILITGATSGIGQALATTYAEPGCTLVLHGRNRSALESVATECRSRGACVALLCCDLQDAARWRSELTRLATERPIDLAIVNAGVTSHIGREGNGEAWESIEAVIDVNIRAALATTEVLIPLMRQRGQGQIALVSSVAAYFGLPLTPSYCASKAALKAYGEALRGWLAPEGIGVSVILPGFVHSKMSREFPGPKMFILSAEDAARRIRRRLLRNPARIAFPAPLHLGLWSLSVLPPAVSIWILGRLGYTTNGRAIDHS